MSVMRSHVYGPVRTAPEHNSGTLDNGQPWDNWTVEVLDEDVNKIKLRVPESLINALAVGQKYDLTVDVATNRTRFTATIVDAKKV